MRKIFVVLLSIFLQGTFAYSSDQEVSTGNEGSHKYISILNSDDDESNEFTPMNSTPDVSGVSIPHCLGKLTCCDATGIEPKHEFYSPGGCQGRSCRGLTVGLIDLFLGAGALSAWSYNCAAAIGLLTTIGCITTSVFMPDVCLEGAKYCGNREFVSEFEEGQSCLPEHTYSYKNAKRAISNCIDLQ